MQTEIRLLLRQSLADEQSKLKDAQSAFMAQPCADENEVASFFENLHVATAVMQRSQQRLRHLESRIHILETQQHGVCQDCHEHIPAARLAALPDVTRCIACQEEWEAEQLALQAAHIKCSPSATSECSMLAFS